MSSLEIHVFLRSSHALVHYVFKILSCFMGEKMEKRYELSEYVSKTFKLEKSWKMTFLSPDKRI